MGALNSRRPGRLVAVGLVAALTLAACSGDDDAADDATEESADTAEDTAADSAIEEAEARADAAEEAAAAAQAEVDALSAQVEEQAAAVAEAEAQLDDTTATLEALAASETIRADTAEGEVQRFSDLFPIEVESTLDGIVLDQEGVWNLSWSLAYSDNSLTGFTPAATQATFARTPEGFLRLQVAGVFDEGLFDVNGSLYAIGDTSDAVLAPCADGTLRPARVTVTVYADDIRIEADGTRSVTGLEGAITIDSLAEGACDGLAFYGVQLTRP